MAGVRSFPAHVDTARLTGDKIVRTDAAALVPIVADPGIPEAMFPARFRGPGRTRAGVDRMARHWEEHGFGPWTARLRDGGEVVGRAGLLRTVVDGEEAVECGWFVARAHWGRGYAPELAACALEHGFGGLGLEEIVAFTLPTNSASQAVMAKLGLERAGEIEHAGLPHVLFRARAASWAPPGPAGH